MENSSGKRMCVLSLAELIDRMTITQIKLALLENGKDDFSSELDKLEHDIDLIIVENELQLTGNMIRLVIILSQMNLHIWHNKDEMQSNLGNDSEYLRLLKIAHQLNGFRNQVKNLLLDLEGVHDQSQRKTNLEVDGLDWIIR
jgi:hypothetical protein